MKSLPLCVLLAGSVSGVALARDGDLLESFGENGLARLGIVDAYGSVTSNPVLDANGKITYCATRDTASGLDFVIARANPDGTPDTSFSGDGKLTVNFGGNDDECAALVVQADGRIVVAGSTTDGATITFALARITTTGTLDASFGTGGRQQVQFDVYGSTISEAHALAIQPDGRLLVAGYMRLADASRNMAIVRLLPDGSYDASFNGTGRQRVEINPSEDYSRAHALALDGSGRVLLAGEATKRTNDVLEADFAIARLSSNGTLDESFGDGGHTTIAFDFGADTGSNHDVAYAMQPMADGRIVLAGEVDVSATATPNMDMAFVRLRGDGTLDPTFGNDGRTLVEFDRSPGGYDTAQALILDGENIVAGGYAKTEDATGADLAFVRLLPNGARDQSFGNFGRRTFDFGFTNPGVQLVGGLARDGSRLLFAGLALTAPGVADAFVGAIASDTLFAYGME